MNIERIKELRDFIATLPEKACDMRQWQYIKTKPSQTNAFARVTFKEMKKAGWTCGSVACIGGWAEIFFNKATKHEVYVESYETAHEILDLTTEEGVKLFYDYPPDPAYHWHWKEWILRRLDGVIEDGEIKNYRSQMKGDFR